MIYTCKYHLSCYMENVFTEARAEARIQVKRLIQLFMKAMLVVLAKARTSGLGEGLQGAARPRQLS